MADKIVNVPAVAAYSFTIPEDIWTFAMEHADVGRIDEMEKWLEQWFLLTIPALGFRTPREVVEAGNAELVKTVLGRIFYGVYS
jgi:uncharacterized protein (DUF2384 family)